MKFVLVIQVQISFDKKKKNILDIDNVEAQVS